MKKIGKIAVFLILGSMVWGCGRQEESPDVRETAIISEEKPEKMEETSVAAVEEETEVQAEDVGDEKVQVHQDETAEKDQIKLVAAQKAEPVRCDGEKGRQLSNEELQAFTSWIGRSDNYGFLLSIYDTPAEVDLDEIFYCGAGIEQNEVTEEEIEAYLHACGWDEIYTDFEKLTTEQIDAFLQKKTGLSYEQMNGRLRWTYLPEYDAYYAEHGDTNYRAFSCVEGYTADEQVFTLRCRPYDLGGSDSDGYHVMDYELKLERWDGEYRFLSNRMMWERGLIEEQSFAVALEPLGNVIFASYAPDIEVHPFADVSFFILRDGRELRRLQGIVEGNIRENEVFHQVEAVAFADYNEDGNTDVIIIADYALLSEEGIENICAEIRLYEGKNEYLYYDQEMSEKVNLEADGRTIRSVLDYIAQNL
ncbi:MAG: hypothetical protein K2H52_09590 [Lachnospiraceae bacterium]|nr:hypothetical protein [Lachnospiraceae bacterium]MDE6183966.1 hypothetical protein [Lachnospiraceae bacterium]